MGALYHHFPTKDDLGHAVIEEVVRAGLDAMVFAPLRESDAPFDVLAHIDYPKRYWPQGSTYDACRFEGEFRKVLRAAARREVALEINTTRGGAVERYLCPAPAVLNWWREEGGRAVSFGSDAHSPGYVGRGFDTATELARSAGFEPQVDPNSFWVPS